ncbi:MAG TPA: sodium:proton antiporter [Acidobacteriota bacterium]|nr:sodium:proton antiporter [Acidobacteriota bacterium]HQF86627.1 sodium:proton antiporter [Acidobacteriota bacterium]HQG90121.1 sodium:proton antiporter [Acidobacteriota bacterium]
MPPPRNVRFFIPIWLVALTGAAHASAADTAAHARHFPLWVVAPFLGILISIAVFPLINARWWEHNYGKVSVFWLSTTFVIMLLARPAGVPFADLFGGPIFHTYEEYVSFIILLGSLFVIAGGIVIRGSLSGRPVTNLAILGIGTVLASFIGTTGAAMLLIRPLIKSIRWRQRQRHVVIFFIFLVCNIGGSLTPIGDPPLFIGFLRGVPFEWTLALTPIWALTSGLLLAVFYLLDRHLMKKETGVPPDMEQKGIRIEGLVNIALLAGVIGSVLFSGLVKMGEIHLGLGALEIQNVVRDAVMLALAGASLALTPRVLRAENNFNYAPIIEVALLFVGIFTTMIPALMVLNARGAELGIDSASKFFWATGILSSFLDNTPTYMSFLETACGMLGMTVTQLLQSPQGTLFLKAISVGAVFMGANTYIGNGPNFMVKAIAEQEQIRMPSFFGYMAWSVSILIPVFILVDVVFFL